MSKTWTCPDCGASVRQGGQGFHRYHCTRARTAAPAEVNEDGACPECGELRCEDPEACWRDGADWRDGVG